METNQNNATFYTIMLKTNEVWYFATVEYYNPFTCFLQSKEFGTIFGTFNKANDFKRVMLEWKKKGKLCHPFKDFQYVTVAEVKEVRYKRK